MRRPFALLAIALSFTSLAAHAQQASSTQRTPAACDRACLRQMLGAYMAAVFKHDPAAVRLAQDHYATENTVVVSNGEGFWKQYSGYGEVNRGFFDPANSAAAFLGTLKQTGGGEKIASVRIQIQGGKISEAEWIVASQGPGGRGESDPRGLAQYPPPTGTLAPAERTPRFMMKSLANDFYQAVADHYGEWVPNDPNCYRVENGGPPLPKEGCLGNFEAFDQSTKDIALRRFPVIDEEAGVVLCSVVFVRYPGSGRQDNLVNEYILIRGGQIAAWWTSMYFLPLGSPVTSGWENRHWIRR